MNHETDHDRDPDLDDRFLDALLAEHEGHGPDPGLVERTLRAVAAAPTARPQVPARSRWLVAACALLGLSAVVAIAWQQRAGGAAATAAAPDDGPQDPTPTAIPDLLRDLGADEPAKATTAQTALVRLGKAAVPDLAKALGDPNSARVRVLAVLDAIEADAASALDAVIDRIADRESPDELVTAAMRTASTLIAFAGPEARQRARDVATRSMSAGQGPGGPGGLGGGMAENPFARLAYFTRLVRRCEADIDTAAKAIALLASGDPYERELAARRLAEHPTPEAVAALRTAIATEHPNQLEILVTTPGGQFSFSSHLDGAAVAMIPRTAAHSLVAIAAGKDASALGHAWLLEHGATAEQRAAATGLCGIKAAPDDQAAVDAALLTGIASDDLVVVGQSITAVGLQGRMTPALRLVLENRSAAGPAPISSLVQVVLGKF